MAAPFFGTTLTDLGRNITDRGMVDVAQQQAQQAYLAQLAATRAQERNVGTQVQGNRDIAQMQNESRVAHEQAIQQLNTERNELLKQESQARTELEKERIQSQLMMNERQIAAQQQMFAAQAYLSALGGGQQTMAPGVAQEYAKAQLEAGRSADEVNRQRSIYQEMVDKETAGGSKRTWLGVIPTPFKSDPKDRLSSLVKNPEFNNKFVLQDVVDPATGQKKLTVVPREGVIPTVPSTTRPPMSPDQMGEFFNSIMSIFGQGGGFPQFPGTGVTPGGTPPPVPPVPPVPDVVGQSRVAWDAASPITGAGSSFGDPYANNPLAAWVRGLGLSYDGNPVQGGALQWDDMRGYRVAQVPPGVVPPSTAVAVPPTPRTPVPVTPERTPINIDALRQAGFMPLDTWSQGMR